MIDFSGVFKPNFPSEHRVVEQKPLRSLGTDGSWSSGFRPRTWKRAVRPRTPSQSGSSRDLAFIYHTVIILLIQINPYLRLTTQRVNVTITQGLEGESVSETSPIMRADIMFLAARISILVCI